MTHTHYVKQKDRQLFNAFPSPVTRRLLSFPSAHKAILKLIIGYVDSMFGLSSFPPDLLNLILFYLFIYYRLLFINYIYLLFVIIVIINITVLRSLWKEDTNCDFADRCLRVYINLISSKTEERETRVQSSHPISSLWTNHHGHSCVLAQWSLVSHS